MKRTTTFAAMMLLLTAMLGTATASAARGHHSARHKRSHHARTHHRASHRNEPGHTTPSSTEPSSGPGTEGGPTSGAPSGSNEGHGRPAAPGSVVSYLPADGTLSVQPKAGGDPISARVDSQTDVRCRTHDGGGFAPCDASKLVAGTPVVGATYVPADAGNRWIRVYLQVVPAGGSPSGAGDPSPGPVTPGPGDGGSPPSTIPGGQVTAFDPTSGAMTLLRDNGEHVTARVGPSTNLRCAPTAAGPFVACDAGNIVVGRHAASAAPGHTDGGNVWTMIYLIVPAQP